MRISCLDRRPCEQSADTVIALCAPILSMMLGGGPDKATLQRETIFSAIFAAFLFLAFVP